MIGGTIVSNARLMKPLFYDGNFNRDGKKMRAVFEREISDGTVSYRLWRSDGKPDIQYPRAENDNYLLYAEIRDYLVPLRITDFYLIDHDYPGIFIELRGEHLNDRFKEGAVRLAWVEYSSDKQCLQTIAYGDGNADDFTHLIEHEHILKTFE